jgi:hypothetical protein
MRAVACADLELHPGHELGFDELHGCWRRPEHMRIRRLPRRLHYHGRRRRLRRWRFQNQKPLSVLRNNTVEIMCDQQGVPPEVNAVCCRVQ